MATRNRGTEEITNPGRPSGSEIEGVGSLAETTVTEHENSGTVGSQPSGAPSSGTLGRTGSSPTETHTQGEGVSPSQGETNESSSGKKKTAKKKSTRKADQVPIENYEEYFKKRKGVINRTFTKKSPISKFLPAKTPAEKLDGWRKDNKDKLNERSLLNDTETDLSTLTWLKDKYYIQLAQNTSDLKFEIFVKILKSYDIPVVKSSKIVGAFDTKREANRLRKFIIGKGISCTVSKFE